MPAAAGVTNDDGDESEIRRMPRRGLDADLDGEPNDGNPTAHMKTTAPVDEVSETSGLLVD
jgi:hypothetical protein